MTDRHAQQRVAAALSRLLTLPLPEASSWHMISLGPRPPVLSGQLDDTGAGFDAMRARLHQWAAALADSVWHVEDPLLMVRGTFEGARVEVWTEIPPGLAALGVAELALLDEPAGGGDRLMDTISDILRDAANLLYNRITADAADAIETASTTSYAADIAKRHLARYLRYPANQHPDRHLARWSQLTTSDPMAAAMRAAADAAEQGDL